MRRALLVSLIAVAGCHGRPAPVPSSTPAHVVAPPPAPPPDDCPDQADGVAMTPTLLVTPRVEFDLYRGALAPDALPIVDSVARRMLACTPLQIEIEVHTDTARAASFNLAASQRVADAIRARLVAQGVPAARLAACGYGESQPLTTQPSWEHSPNARVEWHRVDVPMARFACPVISVE